jgi:hypothetical protein
MDKFPTEKQLDASPLFAPKAALGIPYILYYRQGSNPHPQFFIFFHKSDKIREVVDRIKKHCEMMNLRFVNVRPAIVDLDEAEAKVFGSPEPGAA